MTLTIEIPEHHAKTLSQWFSVTRTLVDAARIIEFQTKDHFPLELLREITPALGVAHSAIRSAYYAETE